MVNLETELERLRPKLIRRLRGRGLRQETAEDTVQDMARLVFGADDYDPARGSLETYLSMKLDSVAAHGSRVPLKRKGELVELMDEHGRSDPMFAVVEESLSRPANDRPRDKRNGIYNRDGLTRTQVEVCRMLSRGMTRRQIAEDRGVEITSVDCILTEINKTLGTHGAASILHKLGCVAEYNP